MAVVGTGKAQPRYAVVLDLVGCRFLAFIDLLQACNFLLRRAREDADVQASSSLVVEEVCLFAIFVGRIQRVPIGGLDAVRCAVDAR